MLFVHKLLGTWSKKVTAYIALTEFQKQKMIEGGLPEQKIWVKPNFLQTTEGGSQRTDFAARKRKETQKNDLNDVSTSNSDLTCGKPYALFVGRLSAEKGCDVLIRAWSLFCEKWQKDAELEASPVSTLNGFNDLNATVPQLLIVGDGPERDSLEKLASHPASLIPHPALHFLGKQPKERVLALMRSAQFLVFPSIWYETFGLTVLEAGLQGTPSLISNCSVASGFVEDGKSGLFFEAGNSVDLAQKIQWAFEHPEQMREMGKAARQEYEKCYTAEMNHKILMDIYRQVVGLADIADRERED
jgi:glycosyltransferase involved in cell wall biosynthesis